MDNFDFYLGLGWDHIISSDALDHQLFLLVLTLGYSIGQWRKLIVLITAFTVGHSLTLALSASKIVFLPSYLIEILIPVTIAVTSLENLISQSGVSRISPQFRYGSALFFGLIHGLGFANVLTSMLGKHSNLVVPLLGFNIGLELGQIALAGIFLSVISIAAILPGRVSLFYRYLASISVLLVSAWMIWVRI